MNHPNAKFDYTGHFHSEYEINLVINGRGERIVGTTSKSLRERIW